MQNGISNPSNMPLTKLASDWPLRFILLLGLSLAFALRLYLLDLQDIWWDEARNIDVALRPFSQIATAPELDIHPPIYFWLLHGWAELLKFNYDTISSQTSVQIAFAMRFVSVWAGVLSIALLYPLTSLCTRNPWAALGAVLFATLSPFWLAESQEARMYAVSFALLLGASLCWLKGAGYWVVGSKPHEQAISNIQYLISFVFLSALALLTHYNAVFILISWYIWWGCLALLHQGRWQHLRTIIFCGVGTGLLFSPIIPIAWRQIPTYANPNLTIPTVRQYLYQNWQAYIGGYAWTSELLYPQATNWLWFVLIFLITGILFAYLQAITNNVSPVTRISRFITQIFYLPTSFLLVWLLGSLGLYYIAVLDRGAFNPRYSSFATPALYALIAVALGGWGHISRPLAVAGTIILLFGVTPAVEADLHDPRFAREATAEMAEWLRQQTNTKDLILVDQKYPFGFFYQPYTANPETECLANVPGQMGSESDHTTAAACYLFVDINTIDQRLSTWARDVSRVFWINWFESDTDPRRVVSFLLDKAGRRAGKKVFRGYIVRWWELAPPNTFPLTEDMIAVSHIFPPAVETLALSLPRMPIEPGNSVPVVLRWKRVTVGDIDRPLKARLALHRVDESGILGQDDRPILNDRHRLPSQWSRAETPLNVYQIPTPADLTPGIYEIRLLVYDAETLEALTLVDIAGNPAGIEALLGTVTIQ